MQPDVPGAPRAAAELSAQYLTFTLGEEASAILDASVTRLNMDSP